VLLALVPIFWVIAIRHSWFVPENRELGFKGLKSLQKHCQTVFSSFLATTLGNLWDVQNISDFLKETSLITGVKTPFWVGYLDHLACDLGQITLLQLPRPLNEI
jgi:hypothetical protein